ncbi:hypothetical protein [Crocinitomix catalasitica]|uniref:hypothetical protein n=1 Tax=Crocinitomix catalasitica TaxID=184607 RepID=UPI000481322D|nr:hypothetical protein [Crocinitomix catalasitica]
MKTLNIFLLFISLLIVSAPLHASTTAEPTKKIALVKGDEKLYNGTCFGQNVDFSDMIFKVVYEGEVADNYKVIGGIIYLKSDPNQRFGQVNASGNVVLNSTDVFKDIVHEQVNVELKVVDETTNERMSFTYYFYCGTNPELMLGTIKNGDSPSVSDLNQTLSLQVQIKGQIEPLKFEILSGSVTAEGSSTKGKVLANGMLDDNAKKILKKSSGKQVTILVNYKEPGSEEKRAALVFKVQ